MISIVTAAIQCALIVVGVFLLPTMEAYLLLSGALGGLAAAIALVLPMPEEDSE
jgi:hypothetical protein